MKIRDVQKMVIKYAVKNNYVFKKGDIVEFKARIKPTESLYGILCEISRFFLKKEWEKHPMWALDFLERSMKIQGCMGSDRLYFIGRNK